MDIKKTVVIIGGGFGGLVVAQRLGDNPNLKVVLVDKHNHHLFQPLLYQVAMAGLTPAEISYPLRSVLSKKSQVEIIMEKALEINREKNEVKLQNRKIKYDYLVVATGVKTNYFGNFSWNKRHC